MTEVLGERLVRGRFVGDPISDVEAADSVGARPSLVRTGAGAATEPLLAGRVPVFDDLHAVAQSLLAAR